MFISYNFQREIRRRFNIEDGQTAEVYGRVLRNREKLEDLNLTDLICFMLYCYTELEVENGEMSEDIENLEWELNEITR